MSYLLLFCDVARTRHRLPTDDSEDKDTGGGDKDSDRRQGSTWGSLFAAAGQGGRSGGMSPTRGSEVKKAIRAAMAFGLPKGRGAGGGGRESGRTSPTGDTTGGKDDEPEMDKDGGNTTNGNGAGKGTTPGVRGYKLD